MTLNYYNFEANRKLLIDKVNLTEKLNSRELAINNIITNLILAVLKF